MNASAYLAFDLGASSGRAVVGRLRGQRMAMEEVHRFDTPLRQEEGRLSWDLEALWHELREGLARALAEAPALQSLSVDSWAVDYVPLGPDGDPLADPRSYRDERTQGWMARAFETVPAEEVFATTGIQFLPFNTLYQLLAERAQDAALAERTHLRLPVADYFNYRLGGRAAVERSMASTTQLMDARRGMWAEGLMQRFGLSAAAWPPVVPPGTVLGTVREDVLPEDIRPPAPIRVVAGLSHDTGCAVAAVPAESSAGWAYVSSGTWSLLGAELDAPILTEEARAAGFTNEAGLDGTIRFLKNLTGLWALQECVREWCEAGQDVSYDLLVAEAEAHGPAPAHVDLEDDRFLGRGGMETRLKDYCRETGQPVPATRGALTRTILESIAAGYRRALDTLEQLTGTPIKTLHVVGGGSQNDLFCRLTADAAGCRVVAGPVEATALGNLLVQARTMGTLPEGLSLRQVALRSSSLTTFTPDPTASSHPNNAPPS